MSIAEEIRATFRDSGVDAHVKYRRVSTKGYEGLNIHRWLIDIAEGRIRQVIIEHQREFARGYYSPNFDESSLTIQFLVPDSRIGPEFPQVRIRSVRVRNFPVLGKVKGIRWKGKDKSFPTAGVALDVVARLSKDNSITAAVAKAKSDITIEADHARGCWVFWKQMKAQYRPYAEEVLELLGPTRRQWDCYQAIASHLLGTPLPPNT